ncbi:hypothetical protein SNEBB_001796 [Seison nebaliae]|nr:hypothetical protein SNEBB_001796 [Seison nebaliae]
MRIKFNSLYNFHLSWPVSLCTVANFINTADRTLLPLSIHTISSEVNLSLRWEGFILSAFFIGYISSQVLGASTAKKFGGKMILSLSVFFWSLITLLTPHIVHINIWWLLLSRILLGVMEGLALPASYHIIAESSLPEERSRHISYLMAGGASGQMVAAFLSPHFYWQSSFYFFGISGIVWVVVWHFTYNKIDNSFLRLPMILSINDTKPSLSATSLTSTSPKKFANSQSSLTSLNQIRTADENGQSTKFIAPILRLSAKKINWKDYFNQMPLISIYLAHFAMGWMNYTVILWLPKYLEMNLGANRESLSFTAVPFIFNTISGIFSGHIADELIVKKKWSILNVRRLMTSLGLLPGAISFIIFANISSLSMAILCIAILMGFSAFNSSGHMSNHADIGGHYAGVTFAIANTIGTIPGILCGPITVEIVQMSHGRWFPVFFLAAILNLFSSLFYHLHSSTNKLF